MRILDATRVVDGLNVIVLEAKTMTMTATKYFDVVQSDSAFADFLKTLRANVVVMIVSHGAGIMSKLSIESRQLLTEFGSRRLAADAKETVGATAAFAFIGMRGLESGVALETLAESADGTHQAVLKGCVRFPLGPVVDEDAAEVTQSSADAPNPPANLPHLPQHVPVLPDRKITYGDRLALCGMKDACPSGHTPMSFYSGKNKDDEPKICVDGRFVIGRNLNGAGESCSALL